MSKLVEYTGDKLGVVKGWVKRRLVIYVNGANQGGPLEGYRFFLVFEDRNGKRQYTLPYENIGYSVWRTAFQPNTDGVLHIAPTSVHPSVGALVIKAFAPTDSRNLPDYRARCIYRPTASGSLMFKVEYGAMLGQEITQENWTDTMGAPIVTDTESREGSVEGGFEVAEIGIKIGGKVAGKNVNGRSIASGMETYARQNGKTTVTPVEKVQKISIRQIALPPNM